MKVSAIAVLAFLLIGCESSQPSAALTSAQARAIAIRLANGQAGALYHCKPFRGDPPARFTQGHWVWSESRGYGHGDIQAEVELAADGSTNSVKVELFDNQNRL